MTSRAPLGDRSLDLMQALDALMRRLMRQRHARPRTDIPFSRMDIRVLSIAGTRAEWTMGDLARETALSVSGLTAVVDRLVSRRLVERQRAARDRRVVLVQLTAQGRRLHEQAHRHRRQMATAMLAPLDDREQRVFLALMHKIGRGEAAAAPGLKAGPA
jgi:DNA-binding MarR family transcriptional regulator